MWGSDPGIYIESNTMANYALERIKGYMHKRWTKKRDAPGSNGGRAKVVGGLAGHAIAKVLLRDKGSRRPLLSASRLHNAVTKPHPSNVHVIDSCGPSESQATITSIRRTEVSCAAAGVMVCEKFAAAGFQTCWVATFPSFP